MIQFPDEPDMSGYGEKDRVCLSNVSILRSYIIKQEVKIGGKNIILQVYKLQ